MKNSNIASLDASNWIYEFEKLRIANIPKSDLLSKVQENSQSSLPPSNTSTAPRLTKLAPVAPFLLDKNTAEVIIAYTGTNKDGNALQDIIGADNGGIGMVFGIPSITVVIMSK